MEFAQIFWSDEGANSQGFKDHCSGQCFPTFTSMKELFLCFKKSFTSWYFSGISYMRKFMRPESSVNQYQRSFEIDLQEHALLMQG